MFSLRIVSVLLLQVISAQLATAVNFSRETSNAHFPSDVFLGAALGYPTTRDQVLRRR